MLGKIEKDIDTAAIQQLNDQGSIDDSMKTHMLALAAASNSNDQGLASAEPVGGAAEKWTAGVFRKKKARS